MATCDRISSIDRLRVPRRWIQSRWQPLRNWPRDRVGFFAMTLALPTNGNEFNLGHDGNGTISTPTYRDYRDKKDAESKKALSDSL